MKCFIQSISVDPIIIHYWTENGIRLWHELVATEVVFLDATGSVLRPIKGSKHILYYEMSFKVWSRAVPVCQYVLC